MKKILSFLKDKFKNKIQIIIIILVIVLFPIIIRFLYKGIIINQNKKLSQPTLKRRFFKKKAAFFSWPGLGKEWC